MFLKKKSSFFAAAPFEIISKNADLMPLRIPKIAIFVDFRPLLFHQKICF